MTSDCKKTHLHMHTHTHTAARTHARPYTHERSTEIAEKRPPDADDALQSHTKLPQNERGSRGFCTKMSHFL